MSGERNERIRALQAEMLSALGSREEQWERINALINDPRLLYASPDAKRFEWGHE